TSNILVTRPLTAAEWRDVGMLTTQVYSDTRKLLFYWRRLPDDRLLFGGRAGVLDTPAGRSRCRRRLEAHVAAKWPALRGVASEYFWSGKVCLSYDLMPHVNRADGDPSVAYALAYQGSGVAMSTYCGGLVADLVAGKDVRRGSPLTSAPLRRVLSGCHTACETERPARHRPSGPRHRGAQRARVRMRRRAEDLRHGADLHETSEVHHADTRRHVAHQTEIVRDHQVRRAERAT